MDRRIFLQNGLGLGAGILLPSLSYGYENNEKDYELYKRKFIYDPVATREQKAQDPTDVVAALNEENKKQITNEILPFKGKEQENFWNRPRKIFIRRTATGEQSEIIYHANGQLHPQNYWLASYLLRDVKAKKMVYIDPRLLDLMSAVQAWLQYYGIKSPLYITSGFRTPQTNYGLEGAAKNSMHMHGKAIDFYVPQLNVKYVANIAAKFRAGGIGLYPSRGFIHLDTGGVRTWVN